MKTSLTDILHILHSAHDFLNSLMLIKISRMPRYMGEFYSTFFPHQPPLIKVNRHMMMEPQLAPAHCFSGQMARSGRQFDVLVHCYQLMVAGSAVLRGMLRLCLYLVSRYRNCLPMSATVKLGPGSKCRHDLLLPTRHEWAPRICHVAIEKHC